MKTSFPLKDYTLVRPIDCGATCEVWLAVHNPSHVNVAIKMIDKKNVSKPELFLRLLSSISLVKNINHPFINRFLEYYDMPDYYYVVLEYCENGTLDSNIKENSQICENIARKIFIQLALALDYLHNVVHVVHRDIKPQNVLLDKNNNIHLADFGLSKTFQDGKPLFTTFCGTVHYIAPELLYSKTYSSKADIWSLGVLLYYMVCGTMPFDGQSVGEISQKISYSDPEFPLFLSFELRNLLQQMMNKNPDQRPSIQQVLLHPWLNHNNLIELMRYNIRKFNESHKHMPLFTNLSDKIIYLEKERECFANDKIPENSEEIFPPTPTKMSPGSCNKILKTIHRTPKTIKKSRSTQMAIQFPRRKSMI